MTKTEFNLNFIIRHYPLGGAHGLIGLDTMKGIVIEGKTVKRGAEQWEGIMKRIDKITTDNIEVKMRTGIRFKIIAR